MPSSLEDLESEETKADMEKYMVSGVGSARERMALMRMAWDFVGTEFGNRHQQYEKFYGGASHIVKMNMFRNYDFKRAGALVDRALALPE
jgi:4-hydroxyphenylacetate 3-monooxygenase